VSLVRFDELEKTLHRCFSLRPRVRLFESITRHRVPWIREASQAERIESTDEACIVESIEW